VKVAITSTSIVQTDAAQVLRLETATAREKPKPTRHCNPDAPTAVPAAACWLCADVFL